MQEEKWGCWSNNISISICLGLVLRPQHRVTGLRCNECTWDAEASFIPVINGLCFRSVMSDICLWWGTEACGGTHGPYFTWHISLVISYRLADIGLKFGLNVLKGNQTGCWGEYLTPRGGKQQKLHSDDVRNLCSLPNTSRGSSRGDSDEWGVLRAWERKVKWIQNFDGKTWGMRQTVRYRRKWGGVIKIYLKQLRWERVYWIRLVLNGI